MLLLKVIWLYWFQNWSQKLSTLIHKRFCCLVWRQDFIRCITKVCNIFKTKRYNLKRMLSGLNTKVHTRSSDKFFDRLWLTWTQWPLFGSNLHFYQVNTVTIPMGTTILYIWIWCFVDQTTLNHLNLTKNLRHQKLTISFFKEIIK